ncbi:MAG: magnetochrome domain-containing protein [Planctomycetota bacterium]|jgi:hypothetical protein
MTHEPKRLMMCLLVGLPVVMMGLGLATGHHPRSGVSDSYLPAAPAHFPREDPMIAVNRAVPQGPWAPCPPAAASAAHASPVRFQRSEPMIGVNQATPQGLWDLFPPVGALAGHAPTSPAASSPIKMLPFQEAHWQGLEVIPLTGGLKRVLKIPSDAKGVIIDDVTAPADMGGFQAGDLITSVGQVPTPTLESFIEAADRVRDRRRTEVRLLRKGKLHSLVLTGLQQRLGTANGETAPMIKPGSRPPHGYLGACTNCHHIGTTGQLAVDQGDLLTRAAPPIRAGQTPPHRNRGECTACHTTVQ